jgi:ubiquitin C-terminal hydrolase
LCAFFDQIEREACQHLGLYTRDDFHIDKLSQVATALNFNLELEQTYSCTNCEHSSVVQEKFTCLSLDIPQNSDEEDIE